jgi:hypothetical protein
MNATLTSMTKIYRMIAIKIFSLGNSISVARPQGASVICRIQAQIVCSPNP